MDTSGLTQGLAYYHAHRDELVAQYHGQYVVISDENVHGGFSDSFSAVDFALTRYAPGQFLVRRVLREAEEPEPFRVIRAMV